SASVDSRYRPDRFRPVVRIGARAPDFITSAICAVPLFVTLSINPLFFHRPVCMSAFPRQSAESLILDPPLHHHYTSLGSLCDLHTCMKLTSNACLTLSLEIIR